MNVTLFRNRVFADAKVKGRLLEWALINATGVLVTRERFEHRHRGILCNNRGRDGSDFKPRNNKDCCLPVEARKGQGKILSYTFQREHNPAGT